MRRLVPTVLLLAACSQPTPAVPSTSHGIDPLGTTPQGRTGRIDTVLDGDSARIVIDGVSIEIRLLGINAPERDECWADESRAALEDLASGRSLTLVGDSTDRFGRSLVHVYDGPINLNLVQVAEGNALVLSTEHDMLPEFLAAEEDAIRLERGLWGPSACGAPIDHGVSIWALEPDAPGRDDMNPNGEFVAIANSGAPVDLTGWSVRDESSVHRYTFPDGFLLDGGSIVRVLSGCGVDDPPEVLHWCADTPVWNNSGDTAILLEPSGTVADRRRYFGD